MKRNKEARRKGRGGRRGGEREWDMKDGRGEKKKGKGGRRKNIRRKRVGRERGQMSLVQLWVGLSLCIRCV
jgi:hypothetical protein